MYLDQKFPNYALQPPSELRTVKADLEFGLKKWKTKRIFKCINLITSK